MSYFNKITIWIVVLVTIIVTAAIFLLSNYGWIKLSKSDGTECLTKPDYSPKFIERSWEFRTPGNKDITFDEDTGLEWLDVNINVGVSADDMIQNLKQTKEYAGFRYATRNELIALYKNAGLTEHEISKNCKDVLRIKRFFKFFGLTYDWTEQGFSKGIHAFLNETKDDKRWWAAIELETPSEKKGNPWTVVKSHVNVSSTNSSIQNVGHFLVRENNEARDY